MKWLSVPIQLSYVKAFNELKKLVIEAYEETKRKTHELEGEEINVGNHI